jgi:hypothetical protein
MSTNPYAAPRAQVADETLTPTENFLPTGRAVPMGNGWTWIAEAWSIFRRAAGTWIGMIAVVFIILTLLAVIPVIGNLASPILAMVFAGGLMLACRSAQEGGLEFGQLFAGFKHGFGALAALGALYLVGLLVIFIITWLVTGAGMGLFTALPGGPGSDNIARIGMAGMLAGLVFLALSLPLAMASWFAPALVVFHDTRAGEAMKASFSGSLKNMLPFLLYGIVLLVIGLIALIPFSIMTAMAGVLAAVPLLLLWILLGPVVIISIYTAYRDIYFSPQA